MPYIPTRLIPTSVISAHFCGKAIRQFALKSTAKEAATEDDRTPEQVAEDLRAGRFRNGRRRGGLDWLK